MIAWENGEYSRTIIFFVKEDPVSCAIYGKKAGLLELPGWKRFHRLAKREAKLARMLNQAKLRSARTSPIFMYGFQVPRNHRVAVELDEKNGNTKWQDAEKQYLQQLYEYSTFKDIGHKSRTGVPSGYKQIRVHFVYATKHDGRFKVRLVARGHLTDTPLQSVYSGVVSTRNMHTIVFLAELNGLALWSTDVGNAYLEAYTQEKVCIIAGPEFGSLAGHILIIVKALYGLMNFLVYRLANVLRDMGFFMSRADPNIWMRLCVEDYYKYDAVYVEDLLIASREPSSSIDLLQTKFRFKLQGTGEVIFHLCYFGLVTPWPYSTRAM
eukprot:Nitzschia sp. Nitz4//scaffold568_size2940//117//1099//NITZ4_009282-RA/size2940-snap-gene-0.0-mRNA-1//-1//CDS//3329554638//4860//frame0